MKSFIYKFLLSMCLSTMLFANAQVTKLSNNTDLDRMVSLGKTAVLISASDSLWRTDGTPAGTYKLAVDVRMAYSSRYSRQYQYIVWKDKLYFAGVTNIGIELWVTDGTAGGTYILKGSSNQNIGSSPTGFMVFNDALYFFALDDLHGRELWKTDGTATGTKLVKDINAGPAGSTQFFGSSYLIYNNALFFTVYTSNTGYELWKTDGTEAGTVLVKDIYPGTFSSDPGGFYAYGYKFLFGANGGTGFNLWKSDGSTDGTELIDIFAPGVMYNDLGNFITFNNKVYFSAREPDNPNPVAWMTDGTTGGTVRLKDSGTGDLIYVPAFQNALVFNNKLIFRAATYTYGPGTYGQELWQTDGTSANISLFKDIYPGPEGSIPAFFHNLFNSVDSASGHFRLFNGYALLSAYTPDEGLELWKTNGTSAGTTLVKDIISGADGSINATYFYTQQYLYFEADNGINGYELWKTDGTAENTTLVADILPGPSSSIPVFLGYLNGIALFAADDGDNRQSDNKIKRDLYRIDENMATLPLTLLQFTGTQSDKSVRLNWTTVLERKTVSFEVERSQDGRQFEMIGSVKAAGNSSGTRSYMYNDPKGMLGSGTKVFYRLKIVNEDNRFIYSNVIALNKAAEGSLFIYPNPVKDELKVMFNTVRDRQIRLTIIDESGKLVYVQELDGRQGSNSYSVNVSLLSKGAYYLNIVTDSSTKTSKFIKN